MRISLREGVAFRGGINHTSRQYYIKGEKERERERERESKSGNKGWGDYDVLRVLSVIGQGASRRSPPIPPPATSRQPLCPAFRVTDRRILYNDLAGFLHTCFSRTFFKLLSLNGADGPGRAAVGGWRRREPDPDTGQSSKNQEKNVRLESLLLGTKGAANTDIRFINW